MKPIKAEKCYISDKLLPLHILLTEEDGVIVIRCLDFSISSHGDTIKEARESIKSTLMDYLKHAIENNSLDNLFDPDLKEYWDMYQRLEIETEKDIFQAHFDKIKGEILTNPHALRAQQSMKHLQNRTNGHNYQNFYQPQ